MTQKELNYVEDIYNHEMLIISVFNDIAENIDDKKYQTVLKGTHQSTHIISKKQEKLLEDCANE